MSAAPPAKLRWRCRRGMRELDVALTRYLELQYPAAGAADRRAFEALLGLQDPQIWAFLLGREVPADRELDHVLEQIRRAAGRTNQAV